MNGTKEHSFDKVRSPAVAGMFYPGTERALTNSVTDYIAQADLSGLADSDRVRAVVAPHAGYVYSGPTAGFAYRALRAGRPAGRTRIYLLGPAHRSWFAGVSTGDFNMATPIGVAPTDRSSVEDLWALSERYQPLPEAHRDEHSLEVQIPFIQEAVSDFELVPLLFGTVEPGPVGRDLAGRLRKEPESRIVVSSDLSHFHDYQTAQHLDHNFIADVLAGDQDAVLEQRQGACGRAPIVSLMEVAAELGWSPHLLDYRNSGDTAGDKRRVVGYAAIAFTEGG
jgi:AmmeMemoRadiSam system protein B